MLREHRRIEIGASRRGVSGRSVTMGRVSILTPARRASAPSGRGWTPPSSIAAGALAAAQAALVSLVAVLAPAVGAWVAAGAAGVSWSAVLRVGAQAWLLAQHTGIAVPAGHVGLVPLGLSAVPLAACWFAARRMARGL